MIGRGGWRLAASLLSTAAAEAFGAWRLWDFGVLIWGSGLFWMGCHLLLPRYLALRVSDRPRLALGLQGGRVPNGRGFPASCSSVCLVSESFNALYYYSSYFFLLDLALCRSAWSGWYRLHLEVCFSLLRPKRMMSATWCADVCSCAPPK